jgi:hypothetical protein
MALKTICTGWTNVAKTGNPYISLKIAGIRCLLFKTEYTDDEGRPKYRLCCDEADAPRLKGDFTPQQAEIQGLIISESPEEDKEPEVPF